MNLKDLFLLKAMCGGSSGSGASAGLSDLEQIAMLIDVDMLPAVHDSEGAILTDENNNVILRF